MKRREVIDYIHGFVECDKSEVEMAAMDDHTLLNYGYRVMAESQRSLKLITEKAI